MWGSVWAASGASVKIITRLGVGFYKAESKSYIAVPASGLKRSPPTHEAGMTGRGPVLGKIHGTGNANN